MTPVPALPEGVARELDRLGERWRQLPLDRAVAHSPAVQALAQTLADDAADRTGMPPTPLPDLGPAVSLDQLRVTAWDALAAGAAADLDLTARLAGLRRTLG